MAILNKAGELGGMRMHPCFYDQAAEIASMNSMHLIQEKR